VIEEVVRLPFRPPLCPDNLFGHLAATAVPGVEEVRDGAYRRTLRLPRGPGVVALRPEAGRVACRLWLSDAADAAAAIAGCRWLLDLDTDPEPVDGALRSDPVLRPIVARARGRRIPRTVDGGELAVRAVLGQQVSTAAARTTTGELAARLGEPIADRAGGLSRLFPTPQALRGTALAMPAARRRAVAALAEALVSGRLALGPDADRETTRVALAELPGIGPWTTEVIAMRALGDPDAFPATDLGVRRAAEALGLPGSPGALTARAERWRPWRAYAVQYLWSTGDHAINRWPSAA